jgi:hypothetical protein
MFIRGIKPVGDLSLRFFRHKAPGDRHTYIPVTYPIPTLQNYVKPQQVDDIYNGFITKNYSMTQLISSIHEKLRLSLLKQIILRLKDHSEGFKRIQSESLSLFSKFPDEHKVTLLLLLFENGEFLLCPTAKYYNLTEFQEELIIKQLGEENIGKLRMENPDFYKNFNNSKYMIRFMPEPNLTQTLQAENDNLVAPICRM